MVQLPDIGHNGLTNLFISFVKFESLNDGSQRWDGQVVETHFLNDSVLSSYV